MTRTLLVDARTARTGGGLTVLDVVRDELKGALDGWQLDVRTPHRSTPPLRPLILGRRSRADAVLGLSESSNVGWPNRPFVMLARNWKCWGADTSPKGRVRTVVATRNARRATCVVAATETFAETVRDAVPDADVRVIPFGVNPVFTPEGDASPGSYLLVVGDLYRHKRLDLALDAFAASGLAGEFEMYLAGEPIDTELVSDLHRRAGELGIAAFVRFLGRTEPPELARLYRGAAATVLTSDLESFGHPYVEAMASGCPVIGRESPVAREVTGGVATLVGPDPAEIGAALKEIVSGDRAALSGPGLQRVAELDWTTWARRLATVIEEAA